MPQLEYALTKQIQRLSLRLDKLRRISERYSNIRLAIVLIGIPSILACFQYIGLWPGWTVSMMTITAFCMVLRCHGLVNDSIARHEIWLELKSDQVARIRLDWDRLPTIPAMPAQADHPFGIDLDIMGERSLHRLMDTTISMDGSRRFLSWLMETEPEADGILKRQALVRELTPLTLFRDKLIMNARKESKISKVLWKRFDAKSLLEWFLKRGSAVSMAKAVYPLTALALIDMLIFGLSAMRIIRPEYFYVLFFLYIGALLFLQGDVKKAFGNAIEIEDTLNELHPVFRHLEKFRYSSGMPGMAGLCAPFADLRNRPSTQLRRISRVISGISVRGNPIIWFLLNGILPWDIYFVRLLERCRNDMVTLLPTWLDTLHEIEALSSLANFAYLNPDYSYPEVTDTIDGSSDPGIKSIAQMCFKAEGLGHPLIPAGKRIHNNFSFDEYCRIALITGSNMAGKSSFLRTLGINICLAYAGAPVCAADLRIGLFRVFACIRINDSLTDGFSLFYAEVKRLKMLLSAVESDSSFPVFFLIDEIFRGTNNIERFIGSREFVRALAKLPTMGAVATHDLELAKLAGENEAISNYHFREDVQNGRMIFDYTLRPGPCPTTNALKIMSMAGLPVSEH